MRRKNSTRLLLLAALATLWHACTEIELCEEPEHPVRGHVMFSYQWAPEDIRRPDSMVLIATRIMNQWKCGIIIDSDASSGDTLHKGRYIYNAPLVQPDWAYVEYWFPPEPVPEPPKPDGHDRNTEESDIVVPPPPAPPVTQYAHFSLRQGLFNFMTLNKSADELIIDQVYDYLHSDEDTLQMADIRVTYKTYDREDPRLYADFSPAARQMVSDWTDYNPGYRYIKYNVRPLYYDIVERQDIEKKVNAGGTDITFRPRTATQNVDVFIEIEKDNSAGPLKIETMVCEISGVPLTMTLAKGYVDMRTTAKVAFEPELLDENRQPLTADTYTTEKVVAHVNMDLTTIVSSRSTAEILGPGLMQCYIKAKMLDTATGTEKEVNIPGRINIHQALTDASMTLLTEDEQHALQDQLKKTVTVTGIKIKSEDIIESSTKEAGFQQWGDGGPIDGGSSDPIEI